ncbi:MAG: hypothetical protein L0Y68_04530 [Candidatus Dadabacteria bacterium]|nr:hypothetical protein [Candidatus Dadabacteria bacterium]
MTSYIDKAIDLVKELDLTTSHHPWEIQHGILANGTDFKIRDPWDNKINALDFLLHGTNVEWYPIKGGIVREDKSGYPYFIEKENGLEAEIHQNLFLGEFSTIGIDLDSTKVVTNLGNEYPLRKALKRAMLHTFPNKLREIKEEPSWVLTSFARYLPMGSWKNINGEEVSIEDIVAYTNELELGYGSCFGTHVMEGIAVALTRYIENTGITPHMLRSPWREAYERLETGIQLVKKLQREDGSIPRLWFKSNPIPRNLKDFKLAMEQLIGVIFLKPREILYATGHTLDWLIQYLPPKTLSQDWVNRIANVTARVIVEYFHKFSKEVSTLTHAAHAIKIYKDKVNH